MGKRIIVFGSGASGLQIASELLAAGNEVILIDNNPKVVDAISEKGGFTFKHRNAEKDLQPAREHKLGDKLRIFNSADLNAGTLPDCDIVINATTDFAKKEPKFLELVTHLDSREKPIVDLANGLKQIDGIPKGDFDNLTNLLSGVINFPSKLNNLSEVEAVNPIDKARSGGFTFGKDASLAHTHLLGSAFGDDSIKIKQSLDKDTAQIVYEKYLQSFMVIPCALVGGNFGDCIDKGTIQNQMTLALLREIHAVATEKGLETRDFDTTYQAIYDDTHASKRPTRGSMQEHALAGKQLELDGFVKNLIDLGREAGIKTPVMEAAYALTKTLEKNSIKQKHNELNDINKKPFDIFRRRIKGVIENGFNYAKKLPSKIIEAAFDIRGATNQNKVALVVIDAQKQFGTEGYELYRDGTHFKEDGKPSMIENLKNLLTRFSKQREPAVIFVNRYNPEGHVDPDRQAQFPNGYCLPKDDGKFCPEIEVVANDMIKKGRASLATKQGNSAMEVHEDLQYTDENGNTSKQNTLAEELKRQGIKEVVLSGIQLKRCILGTAIDLVQQGFKVKVIDDATARVIGDNTECKDDYLKQHFGYDESKPVNEWIKDKFKELGVEVISTEQALKLSKGISSAKAA